MKRFFVRFVISFIVGITINYILRWFNLSEFQVGLFTGIGMTIAVQLIIEIQKNEAQNKAGH